MLSSLLCQIRSTTQRVIPPSQPTETRFLTGPVLRQVKSAIKRQHLDSILIALLQSSRFCDRDVTIGFGAGQQAMLREEPRAVLEHQYQVAELHRLARLTQFVELRARLEEAEQLILVGHLFTVDHAAISNFTHLLRASDERLQRREFQQLVADVLVADDLIRATSGSVTLQGGEKFLRSAELSRSTNFRIASRTLGVA